jgi:hypothetical protein
MTRRLGLAALAAAVALLLAGAAPAHAGTFRLSQCNAVDQGGLAPRSIQERLWWVSGGWTVSTCGAAGGRLRFDAENHRLAHDGQVIAHLMVPDSMPGTSMRTLWLDWHSLPQAESTSPAYFMLKVPGAQLATHATGDGTTPGVPDRRSLPTGTRRLYFETWCSPVYGPGWCNWPSQLLELRGLTVELEEAGEPAVAASGPLTEAGPHAGTEPLWVEASDADSGVRHVAVALGGVPAGAADLAEACRDDRLPPCPQAAGRLVDVDTTRVPDGVQRLRLTATDAAGNQRIVEAGTVLVRNRPEPEPGAPGPAGAGPPPPGPSPFPPNPLAGRGHAPNGTGAREGASVSAWLEPRRGARRHALAVRHGRRVRVRGRLRDPSGRPIGAASLVTIEREPGGRWRVVTGVRTRPDGRFTAFTRIGASRTLRFVYYAFGDSPRGVHSRALRLAVRAPVRIRAWRQGGVVRVRGRLGGGRVPRGGALVELQRLLRGGWTGVGALRTRSDGRFAARVSAPGGAPTRVRALVPVQPGLPFATGRSPAATPG